MTDLATLELTPAEISHRQQVEFLRARNAKLKALDEAIEFHRGVPDLDRVAELEAEKQTLMASEPAQAPRRPEPAKGPILPSGPGTIGTLKLTGQAPAPHEPSTLPPLRKPLPPTGEWPAETSFSPRPTPAVTPEAPAAKPKTKAAKAAAEADVIVPEETAAALGLKRKRPKAFEPKGDERLVEHAWATQSGEPLQASFLREAALELADELTGLVSGLSSRKLGSVRTLQAQLRRYALTGLETGERGGAGVTRPWLRDKLIQKAKELRSLDAEADEVVRRSMAVERLRRMRDRKERESFEAFVDELAADAPEPGETPRGIVHLPGQISPGVGSRMIGKPEEPPSSQPPPPGRSLSEMLDSVTRERSVIPTLEEAWEIGKRARDQGRRRPPHYSSVGIPYKMAEWIERGFLGEPPPALGPPPPPPGTESTRGARETPAPPTPPPAEGIEGLVQQARALPPELQRSLLGIQRRLGIGHERARQVRDALLQETSLPVQPPPPGTELTRGRRGKRGPVEQRTFEEAVRAGRMPDAYIKESFRASDEEIAALREGGGSSTPPPHRPPSPGSELTQGVRGKQGPTEWLSRLQEGIVREAQGHAALDAIEAAGRTPRDVVKEFWSRTYRFLPEAIKDKMHRAIRAETGLAPGDTIAVNREGHREIARSWEEIYPSEESLVRVDQLEGSERGLIVLMETLNRRHSGPIPPGQTAMFTTRETTPGITPGGLRPTAPQVEHDRLLEGFRQPKPSQQHGLPLGSPTARTNPALLRVVQEQLESGVTPGTLRSRVQRGDFPGITETELEQAIREVEQTAPVEQESPFTSLKADMMARAKAGNRQSLFMLYRLFRLRLPMVEKQLGITDADFKALNLSMFPSFMPAMA